MADTTVMSSGLYYENEFNYTVAFTFSNPKNTPPSILYLPKPYA